MIAKTFRNGALGMLIAGFMASGMTGVPAHAQEDRVVAEVNGEQVMLSEVEAAMAGLPPQAQQMPVEMLIPMLAEQVATGRLIAERAYAEGLGDSDEVRERLAQIEEQVVQEVWIDRQINDRLTDELLAEIHQEMVDANPPSEEVSARHILLESQEEAEAAIQRLVDGEEFAALAEELSVGPTGPRGGDLGWFSHGDMVPEFADAAFELEAGDFTSEPVESQFGFHVILVEDRRMPEAPTLDEVRPQVEEQAVRQIVQSLIAELQEGAEIVFYDQNGDVIEPGEAPGMPGAMPQQ